MRACTCVFNRLGRCKRVGQMGKILIKGQNNWLKKSLYQSAFALMVVPGSRGGRCLASANANREKQTFTQGRSIENLELIESPKNKRKRREI